MKPKQFFVSTSFSDPKRNIQIESLKRCANAVFLFLYLHQNDYQYCTFRILLYIAIWYSVSFIKAKSDKWQIHWTQFVSMLISLDILFVRSTYNIIIIMIIIIHTYASKTNARYYCFCLLSLYQYFDGATTIAMERLENYWIVE